MCTPAVAIAATALGTGMSMYGMYQQGQAQKAMYDYQAKMGKVQAEQELSAGREAERAQRRKTASLIGAQRAAMGGSGIDVNTGSLLEAQVDTARMGEMDALTLRYNAKNRAWAARAGVSMSRAAGRNAATAGTIGAASSLLTGAGKVADQYYRYYGS